MSGGGSGIVPLGCGVAPVGEEAGGGERGAGGMGTDWVANKGASFGVAVTGVGISMVAPVLSCFLGLSDLCALRISAGLNPFGSGLGAGFLAGEAAGESDELPVFCFFTPSFGMLGGGLGIRGSAWTGFGISGGGAGTFGLSTNVS